MKLKSILVASAAAAALASGPAAQADNYYVSLFGVGIHHPTAIFPRVPFRNAITPTQILLTPFQYLILAAHGHFATGNQFPIHVKAYPTFTLGVTGTQYTFGRTYVEGLTDTLDEGFVVGAALGMDFQDGWRFELEAAYRQYDIGDNHQLSGTQYLLVFVLPTV